MLRRSILLLLFSAFSLHGLLAKENFKVVYYNLLDIPFQDVPTNRIQYLESFPNDGKVLLATDLNMYISSKEGFIANSDEVFSYYGDFPFYNSAINSSDFEELNYATAIREVLYNFRDHLPVTLEIKKDEFSSITQFVNGNTIDIELKLNINNLTNQTLNVYDTIGKLKKTINIENSIYIDEDFSILVIGSHYIGIPHFNLEPLKFVKAP